MIDNKYVILPYRSFALLPLLIKIYIDSLTRIWNERQNHEIELLLLFIE